MRMLLAGVFALALVAAVTVVGRGQDATQLPAETAKQPESLDSIIAKGWPTPDRNIKNLTPRATHVFQGVGEPLTVFKELLTFRQYARAALALKNIPFGSRSATYPTEPELEELRKKLLLSAWAVQSDGTATFYKEDYWAVLSLIKKRTEEYVGQEQTLRSFAHWCSYLLGECDLWFVRTEASARIRENLTVPQKKAIRAWVVKMLAAFGEKAVAGKKPGHFPDGYIVSALERLRNWLLPDGEPKEYSLVLDKLWVEWYGEPPPREFLRLRELFGEAIEVGRSYELEAKERSKAKKREESPVLNPEKFK